MPQYFETSFGDKIEILPEYENSIRRNKRKYILDASSFNKLKDHTGNARRLMPNDNYTKDFISYAILMHFLEKIGVLPQTFKKALDIGGAEGVHIALFRSQYAEYVVSNDLEQSKIPDFKGKFKGIIEKYKTGENYQLPFLGVIIKKWFPYFPAETSYILSPKREPDVDRFEDGNFFKVIKDENFDIVLSWNTFSILDYKLIIKKVASLLPKGGIFAFMTRYFWGPGGACYLCGNFPYFEKRLTLEDIKKYYQRYKPGQEKYVKDIYYIHDPHRSSLKQYREWSEEQGFELLGFERMIFPYLEDTGKIEAPNRNLDSESILKNISRFRSDIIEDDLKTQRIMMAFKKL